MLISVTSWQQVPSGPNTYSVVGGNTAIIGPQVLAQVAIGIQGTGTLYSTSGNANVFGVGTDLANTLSVGFAIQVGVANINGSTDYVNLGFAVALSGYANIEISMLPLQVIS